MKAFKFLRRSTGNEKPAVCSGGLPEACASNHVEKDINTMTAVSLFSKPIPSLNEGRSVIGPALAADLIETSNYSKQRRVNRQHVESLAASMRRQAWVSGSQLAFGRLYGHLHLVNGQHRLHAVIESGCDIEFQVVILDCADDKELAQLYYTFDRHGRARSDADVLSAVGITDRFGITATTARGVWQAAPIIENGFQRVAYTDDPARRDDDHRLAICSAWWPVSAQYEALLKKAPSSVRQRLLTSQAMAVALVVLKHRPVEANAFFDGIASDDGLRRDDPRKALLIDLAGRAWRRHTLDGCFVLAYSWNAFFRGRPQSQLKVVQNGRFRLEGTPFDGRA